MLPKPKHLGPVYGAQFQDSSVAAAYPTRPPYPDELFDLLAGLIHDTPRILLDLGCGTGDIARRLAPMVTRVDAVDPSAAMLALGRSLPGGSRLNLRWIQTSAEEFDYRERYALVVAAESFHWIDWYRVVPRVRGALARDARLALVLGRGFTREPWAGEVGRLIAEYSTNRDFQPYDLLEELCKRKLFTVEQRVQTRPVPFAQSVDAYVESFHSRNGLSRERMGTSAAEFDARLRAIIARYTRSDVLEFEVVAQFAWGMPCML